MPIRKVIYPNGIAIKRGTGDEVTTMTMLPSGFFVLDEETENIIYEPVIETKMVKICDCGAENPPAARKCNSTAGSSLFSPHPPSVVVHFSFSYFPPSSNAAKRRLAKCFSLHRTQ